MSESVKASRSVVTLGSMTIDGFMLPDGSYRMSQTQAAECIGKSRQGMSDFLRTKAFNRLLGEAGGMSGKSQAMPENFVVEIGEQGSRGETRIVGLPLLIVFIYWAWESFRGNKQALSLIVALGTETLERRFDRAFGISRPKDEWDRRLSDAIINQLENVASNAFNEADAATSREKLLEQQLRELGVEPWALPEQDD
jgi:hypothetical protein